MLKIIIILDIEIDVSVFKQVSRHANGKYDKLNNQDVRKRKESNNSRKGQGESHVSIQLCTPFLFTTVIMIMFSNAINANTKSFIHCKTR